MQCDYAGAWAYVAALTQQSPETAIIDVRFIADRDTAATAIKRRGTLEQLWPEICTWNAALYGVFINISEMDGSGKHEITNVSRARVQALDLDNIDALQQLQAAAAWTIAPAFWVNSSPNKYHVYWNTPYHAELERFTLIQRKLIIQFGGDRRIHDPSRVLRLAGTYHHKGEPHLITCGTLSGFGVKHPLEAFEAALSHVDASAAVGARHELGTLDLAAPSIDWLEHALAEIDPNTLDRGEWVSLMAAYKQAGWLHATPEYLLEQFMKWCERYTTDKGNNPGETLKNWKSIRDSQVGWPAVLRRAPGTKARIMFADAAAAKAAAPAAGEPGGSVPPMPSGPAAVPHPDDFGELLNGDECKLRFDGCIYVATLNQILGPKNSFYTTSSFNSQFGGKKYVIDQVGKVTDEAWKAATRSTLWTVPKVDHIRFLPSRPFGEIIIDELGREGVNTYIPARIARMEGNAQPFLDHIARLLPLQADRDILYAFMAHTVKFPGFKIPWAPVIQSAQGVGKGVIKAIMSHAIGMTYCHYPEASQMADSGAKFNGWMRNKLFILCDEIKVDEQRNMIEVLKPLISETQIEVQSKGVDQRIEDNFTNWMFFTNFKDAVPINANDRRFSVFYSALQKYSDIVNAGMDQSYFDALWVWLNNGGFEIINDWLFRYPIERGAIPMRAPETSSTVEAITTTRSPLEHIIAEAIEDGLQGFRSGFVSVQAVQARAKAVGLRQPTIRTVQGVLEAMGFVYIGKAPAGNTFEAPPHVYALRADMPLEGFTAAQGVMVPPMMMRH